ncbi:MAG: radical SAM protein [Anaerolineaceae bacterium]|nr:radical SAM protein [Anaerolineaceae bacterium]
MANLVVSNVCNAACGYCFANAYLTSAHKAAGPAFMTPEEFEAGLDYLDRSGIDEARLLGGEPTLHPDFPGLLHRARRRGKRITVFTHGAMPQAALHSLLELPPEQCSVVVNMSAVFAHSPAVTSPEERRRQVLQALGQRALLGFNIQSPDFDLGEVIRLAAGSGIRKRIRLGMALPGPQACNHFVHPKQYHLVGRRIAQQSGLAAQAGVCLDLDCGFVRCMFSSDELETMLKNGVQYGWHCGPVLDIIPGREVLHCFALSDRFKRPFQPEATSAGLHAALDALVQAHRTAGVFPACSTCAYKASHECSGGCLAATLRRFQPAAIRLELPQTQPDPTG